MKNISKIIITLSAIFVLSASCNDRKINLPDLPYLIADSVLHFKVGDRFILATSVNSCCQYYWFSDKELLANVPEKDNIKVVEIINDDADPDCAGCSSYTYSIYECTKPGIDSLVYAVIPAGDGEIFEQLSQFSESDASEQFNQSEINQLFSKLKENSYLRVFKFIIHN